MSLFDTIVWALTVPIRCNTTQGLLSARSDRPNCIGRPRASPRRKTSPAHATSMRPAGVPRSGRGRRGVLAAAHHGARAAAPRAAGARRSAPAHLALLLTTRRHPPAGRSQPPCSLGLSLCGSLAALRRAYGVAGEWKAALPWLASVPIDWHEHIALRARQEGRSRRKRWCEDGAPRGSKWDIFFLLYQSTPLVERVLEPRENAFLIVGTLFSRSSTSRPSAPIPPKVPVVGPDDRASAGRPQPARQHGFEHQGTGCAKAGACTDREVLRGGTDGGSEQGVGREWYRERRHKV